MDIINPCIYLLQIVRCVSYIWSKTEHLKLDTVISHLKCFSSSFCVTWIAWQSRNLWIGRSLHLVTCLHNTAECTVSSTWTAAIKRAKYNSKKSWIGCNACLPTDKWNILIIELIGEHKWCTLVWSLLSHGLFLLIMTDLHCGLLVAKQTFLSKKGWVFFLSHLQCQVVTFHSARSTWATRAQPIAYIYISVEVDIGGYRVLKRTCN